MDYSQFAVDLGKRIAGVLENDVDFMAIQKGLTGVVNIPMQNIRSSILENLQLDSTGVIANLRHQMLNADLIPLTATFANAIVEQLNSSAYQNMASQWAVGLLESRSFQLGFLWFSIFFTSLCAPRSCGKMEKTGRMCMICGIKWLSG